MLISLGSKQAAISGLTGREDEFTKLLNDFDNTEFLVMLDKVGKEDLINSNVLNLADYQQESYYRGKEYFDGKAACFGCHGKDGKGIDNMGPQLQASEWVIGSEQRLAKVLLHGLMGPIKVKNIQYDLSMVMPGFAANLTDQELADIATYIRNNWGNKAERVSRGVFKGLREETKGRQLPYTEKELKP